MSTDNTKLAENIKQQGRALEGARWQLPEKFRLTNEQLAKSDADQERLAALVATPFGHPSVPDVFRARAVVVAEHLRSSVEQINKRISAAMMAGVDEDLPALQDAQKGLKHRLAEAYSQYGRYDLSVQVEPDPAYADHYHKILEAVWREDGDWCKCEPHRGSGDHVDMQVSQTFVKEEIWSIKTGGVVFLLACAGCGMLNATSLPDHLKRQRSHRARAQQLVKGMSIEDAEQTLRARKHTSKTLLK